MMKLVLIASALVATALTLPIAKKVGAAEILRISCPSSSFHKFENQIGGVDGWLATVQLHDHFVPIWKADRVDKQEDGTYFLTCNRRADFADFVTVKRIRAKSCKLNDNKGGFLCHME